ncbi:MAG: hypothetical protein HPY50_14490 [Firmicutes bacterium]|nr:hypothetical protein [Bacillota bacterium]
MNTWPFKPMGVGGILDQSFQFYRKNFVQLFLIVLIFYGSIMLLQNAVAYDYSQMSFLPSGSILEGEGFFESIQGMQGEPSLGRALVMFLGSILVLLLMLAFFPVMYASVVVLVKSVVQGESPGLGEVLRGGFRNYWLLLLWSALFGLIVFGVYFAAAIPSVALLFFGVVISGASGSNVLALVFIVGGTLLMVLTIVGAVSFFFVRLGFFLPVITVDDGSEVFSQSWRMTRGSFWRLLGIFLIVHIVIGIFIYGLYFILIITSAFASIIGQLLLILFSVVLYPLSIVVYAFTYFDLKARTEGPDLQDMISAARPQPEEAAGWAPAVGPAAETRPVTEAKPVVETNPVTETGPAKEAGWVEASSVFEARPAAGAGWEEPESNS